MKRIRVLIKNIRELIKSSIECLNIYAICSVVIPFAIYCATLAPSVTFFDSGEFVTATASLGSAHSPGYPLYLMYAKAFTWLPFGNFAFRVNLATAFSSSLACLGVYLLTNMLLKKEILFENVIFSRFIIKMASLAAAMTFAVTPRLWLQSNHDKPYPLLAFITSIVFYLLLQWRENYADGNESPAYIYVCTFLAGLAMALHQTVVLFLPAWCLLIILLDWRIISRVKELVIAISFAMLGFAVHLYLPLRATQNPLLNWGDPKSLTQFLWHFLRKGYQDEPHGRDLSLLWDQLKAFNIPHEFTWLGAGLIIFALIKLWGRHRDVVIAYLVAVCSFLAVIVGYFNTATDFIFLTEEFFTPLYLLSAVMVGVGLFNLLRFAASKANVPEQFGRKVYLLVAMFLLIVPTSLCALNYYENDQHNNYIAYDYATNSLRSLSQNAVMFTWGDSGAFPLWYLQGIERMREDVDIPHTPHLSFDWYLNSMPRVFGKSSLRTIDIENTPLETLLRVTATDLIGKRPVFVDFSTRYSVSFNDFMPVQKGIIYRMRRINEPGGLPDLGIWENYNNRGIQEKISFIDLDTSKAILIYANSYLEAGEFLMSVGRLSEGLQMLTKAQKISPEINSSVQQVKSRYGITR